MGEQKYTTVKARARILGYKKHKGRMIARTRSLFVTKQATYFYGIRASQSALAFRSQFLDFL